MVFLTQFDLILFVHILVSQGIENINGSISILYIIYIIVLKRPFHCFKISKSVIYSERCTYVNSCPASDTS